MYFEVEKKGITTLVRPESHQNEDNIHLVAFSSSRQGSM